MGGNAYRTQSCSWETAFSRKINLSLRGGQKLKLLNQALQGITCSGRKFQHLERIDGGFPPMIEVVRLSHSQDQQ